ncbi:YceI family protein [Gulosibacter faecalis]|jgi:polyisoprenoid-binding protein YceI|uniref:YceI family protein n=1 Tax=Gulosibacter faecalis TaxID=272240 RepID=A0ABW5UWJ2_9MICO|nr:YceI family protein [Gulosibacter faecalis]
MADATRKPIGRGTKITIWVVSALAVIAVAGALLAPTIYRAVFGGSSDVAAPSISETAEAGTGSDDVAGEWTVDSGYAGYRVDEVLQGEDVTVVGRTEEVSGSFTIDGTTLSAGTIEVDVTSIATDNSNRDDYFANDAMEASTYPTASFELAEAAELPDDVTSGETVSVEVTGTLTMHGVSQEVTATLEVVVSGDTAQIVGTVPLTFADYDVEAPSLGFVEVEADGQLEFSLDVTQS